MSSTSNGFIRIRILSLQLQPTSPINPSDCLIRFDLNKQIIDVNKIAQAGFLYFDYTGELITILLTDNKGTLHQLGQAQIRTTDLIKFPDVLQKITVYLAARDRQKGWLERDAGVVVLEFFYSSQLFRGKLSLTIVSAELARDTEMVGQMDPYVTVRYAGKEVRTPTLKNKGKHPDWNHTFGIPITSINERLEIRVYDEDVLKDDEVGKVYLNVREAGFLSMKPIDRTCELYYKQKPAGLLRLKALFSF